MQASAFDLRRQAVEIPQSALPAPVLTYQTHRRLWRLEQHYDYQDLFGARRIRIGRGFLFDLSSVPRPLWWLIAPFELSIVAPLIHDFLYRYGGSPPVGSVAPPHSYSRAEADRLFRTIMEQEHVAGWRRHAAFAAVRTFGYGAWGSFEPVPVVA